MLRNTVLNLSHPLSSIFEYVLENKWHICKVIYTDRYLYINLVC